MRSKSTNNQHIIGGICCLLTIAMGHFQPLFSADTTSAMTNAPSSSQISQFNQLPNTTKAAVLNQVNSQKTEPSPSQPNTGQIDAPKVTNPNDSAKALPSAIELQYSQESESTLYTPKIGDTNANMTLSPKPQQYGYSFFQGLSGSNSAYVNTPTNPDYILGPGDALLIRVWGKIEEQFSVTIDTNGQIYIPKVGVINVAGVSYGAIGGVIKRELGKYYVNFQVSVTVGSMRSIKVFVLGEAVRPGAYDVPAKSTLMTVLYSSGGPSKTGSLRKIQLIRNKRVIKTVDLYDYLMSGNQGQDPMVQNFDTIFIPLIGNTVKIQGIVNRPGIYEIKGDETLYDAVQTLAGGVGPTYYGKRVQVERIVEGQKRIMVDVEVTDPSKFKSDLKSEKVKNGDLITLFPINGKRFNEVSIQGNVARPGTYQYTYGLTLGDLIQKADGILNDTYLQRLEIYRTKSGTQKQIIAINYTATASSRIRLNEFDIVQVHSKLDIDGPKTVKVIGSVNNGGEFSLLEGMKILDLAYLAKLSSIADREHLELARRNDDGSRRIINVNLSKLLLDPQSADNLLLQDQDQLFVRTDIKKTETRTIKISGQIIYPGIFEVKAGERLSDIIRRAGGVTSKAFLPGLVFSRESVRLRQEKALAHIGSDEEKSLLFDGSRIKSLDSQQYREIYDATLKNNRGTTLGRIVLDITSMDLIPAEHNIELQDKDEIYIPQIPTSVQIAGGVQNPSAQVFYPDHTAGFYIKHSGGYSRFARTSDMFVLRESGQVVREGGENISIQPGDTIYVPEEIKVQFDWVGGIFDFSKFIVNVVTGLAVIRSVL